jgi:hypothetical protein
LVHVAESNVLQFLSRLNCINLDALSFIRLTRALKQFNDLLNCPGLEEWIQITAAEFFARYSSVALTLVRNSVAADSWVPANVDPDFVELVGTMPSEEAIFKPEANASPYASSSAVTTVRIVHSLVCLSLELNTDACFNLITQVSSYFTFCIFNTFCQPHPIVDNGHLNRKLIRYFDREFGRAAQLIFKLFLPAQGLTEQKKTEPRIEAQIMQMATATEGLSLLQWYLHGIKGYMERKSSPESAGRIGDFFASLLETVLPSARINLSSVNGRSFLPLKKLKLTIVASIWVVEEVQYEYHEFIVSTGSIFQRFDQSLSTIRLPQAATLDVWRGCWRHVTCVLISAFGSVRDCNPSGRSLMAGDTRALSKIFARCAKIEVDASLVLEFINAYFYKASDFSVWLDSALLTFKPGYLTNLVNTGLAGKYSQKDTSHLLAKIDAFVSAAATG